MKRGRLNPDETSGSVLIFGAKRRHFRFIPLWGKVVCVCELYGLITIELNTK